MRKRTELRGTAALLLLIGAHALAAGPVAPLRPLEDPAALKAAFAARIGQTVDVLDFRFGEHYAQALVRNANDEFDVFEASPGQPMPDGKPKKAGEVECRRKIPFAELDLAMAAHLLAQARTIAAANGYASPENVQLGSDTFCTQFGWRAMLSTDANADTLLELTWATDGASPGARQLKGDGWVKLDVSTLLAGSAKPPAVAPKTEPKTTIAGDGRKRDFLRGIDQDLARIEAQVGAPLALKRISIDSGDLSVDIFQPSDRKRVATWLVDDEGSLRLWREEDTMALDCNKPFAASDIPLAQLPALIAGAPALVPAMAAARVKDVDIYRSGFCGKPHVFIKLEDERGYGNVEYDPRGRPIRAEVQ